MTAPVQQRIERLQAWAYRYVGRDPEEVATTVDALRYRLRPDYVTGDTLEDLLAAIPSYPSTADPRQRAEMDALYEQFHTTRYQEPTILAGIASPGWDQIQATSRRVFPEAAAGLDSPWLATIPVALLNGFVMRETGHHAIVFGEGLNYFPYHLASEIGRFLFVESADGWQTTDPGTLTGVLTSTTEWSDRLFGILMRDAIEPDMQVPSAARHREIAEGPLKDAYDAIVDGFKTFVVAHEYAHCLHRHLDQITAGPNKPVLVRADEVIKEARALAAAKYSHIPFPERPQRWAFTHIHALELDADATALTLVVEAAMGDKRALGPYGKLKLVGALLFWWYAEMSERVHRTFQLGAAWFDDELYSRDWSTQSLLLRPTHPAPLERAHETLAQAYQRYADNAVVVDALSSAWEWLSIFFDTAWLQTRAALASVIRNQGLALHRKWVTAIPDTGVTLGVVRLHADEANAGS